MINKYDYIIAIDPDYTKSGVAIIDTKMKRFVSVESLTFPALINRLCEYRKMSAIVVMENSAVTTNNWHINPRDTVYKAAALGRSVGMCHATAQHLLEMATDMEMATDKVVPFRKCWQGRDGKITHEEASQFMTGLPSKTNQDNRDAALIAWLYAGYPIYLKPIKPNGCERMRTDAEACERMRTDANNNNDNNNNK